MEAALEQQARDGQTVMGCEVAEIHELSARMLSRLLASRELSSVEVVDALVARADAVDGAVNALVHRFEDVRELAVAADNRRRAGESLGPLDGVPLTVKEMIATSGVPVTLGLRHRLGHRADADAVVVRAARAGGAIVLGKTNVPQLLLVHETDNPIWGRTRNPWSLERVPGGSSGGEAAAIAAGMSPWGIGADIGGSIRVPAAFCGICGLKPTRHRWSNVGSITTLAGQDTVRSQTGPMARDREDVALLFEALAGAPQARWDPAVPPGGAGPSAADVDVAGLRVGVYDDDGYLTPAASVRRAVSEAAATLESLGVTVAAVRPVRVKEILATYFAVLAADGTKTMDRLRAGDDLIAQLRRLHRIVNLPRPVRRGLAAALERVGQQRLGELIGWLSHTDVSGFWRLTEQRDRLRGEVLAAWNRDHLDAVICPPYATPALRPLQFRDFPVGGCYSIRYNLLDFPAGVVPITRVKPGDEPRRGGDRFDRAARRAETGSQGLPVGIQVVARPYAEHVVLALMTALVQARRGRDDYPATPVDPT